MKKLLDISFAADVERISHRIAVMLLGEIIQIGPRDQVLVNPRQPYTQKLISAVPLSDPDRKRERRGLTSDKLKSPICKPDWVAPEHPMMAVGDDHLLIEH